MLIASTNVVAGILAFVGIVAAVVLLALWILVPLFVYQIHRNIRSMRVLAQAQYQANHGRLPPGAQER